MTFEKGDKVAVLDAAIRGVVISVSKDTVVMEDDLGFELSYPKRDLVKIDRDQSELSKFSDINNPLLKAKMQSEKMQNHSKKKPRQYGEVPPMEVDLHIQQLVKSSKGMQNFDILNLQLDTAKHKLEFAIRKRIPRIIFIHGVGEGVLKGELHSLLRRYPIRISEGSYHKYGMGATDVYVLQNKG